MRPFAHQGRKNGMGEEMERNQTAALILEYKWREAPRGE